MDFPARHVWLPEGLLILQKFPVKILMENEVYNQ